MNNKYSMHEQMEWPHKWEDKRASEFWPTVKFMSQFIGCSLVIGHVGYFALVGL